MDMCTCVHAAIFHVWALELVLTDQFHSCGLAVTSQNISTSSVACRQQAGRPQKNEIRTGIVQKKYSSHNEDRP